METTRVVIADDHQMVVEAISELLDQETDIQIVGQADNKKELLRLVRKHEPDLIVLDAIMPGCDMREIIRTISAQCPEMKVLVLSGYDDSEYVLGLLNAGATGYILKGDPLEMLIKAIRLVARGEVCLSPQLANVFLEYVRDKERTQHLQLTRREMEVLQLMATGLNNDCIALELVITPGTVKNHVRKIFYKLGVKTRVEAVLYALEHGLVKTRFTQPIFSTNFRLPEENGRRAAI